jgi:hypothetical protein
MSRVGKADEKKSELSTLGMSTADFGAALISEAQGRKQKELADKSVIAVQGIFSSMAACDRQITHLQSWKKTHEGQIAALKEGSFSVDDCGAIVYNDAALNRR